MDDKRICKNKGIKKIAVFTANYQGGILQFAMHLGLVLSRLNYNVTVFIPQGAKITEHGNLKTCRYERFKSLLPNNRFSVETAKGIMDFNPDLVLFCDDTIVSTQTLLAVKKKCKISVFVHDVVPHPEKFKFYDRAKQMLETHYRNAALKKADQVILLSKNSYDAFLSLYPSYKNKTTWMPLGAHIPNESLKIPNELESGAQRGYYLFFGRISKYKGIINLLKAYDLIDEQQKPPLVIAGSGKLQPEEKARISKNAKVKLINRFIDDGEMLYLIKNSHAVVLPYIEASQSGVIPIAYYFARPVITSNVLGLAEFVQDSESGIICSDIEQMKQAMLKMKDEDFHNRLSKGAYKFNLERLDWAKNIKKCIDLIS